MNGVPKKAVQKLLGEVSEDELAVRIIETMGSCKRVQGVTATEVLNGFTPTDVAASARAAARTAILYMAECFGQARKAN